MFANRENLRKFKDGEVVKIYLEEKDKMFDYCAVEGILPYKSDPGALFHYRVIDNGDSITTMSFPINVKYERFIRKYRIMKKDMPHLANKNNESGSLYLITKLEFNEDSLMLLQCNAHNLIEKVPVYSDDEVSKYMMDNNIGQLDKQ